MNKAHTPHTHNLQTLEYMAALSGLSMAGSQITEDDIEFTRTNHIAHAESQKGISFVSLPASVRHSG
jgi:hypothetical protein